MRSVERPPLGTWLRYRVVGGRVPERYLAWVERDVRSPWWPWLSSALGPLAFLVAWFVARVFTDGLRVSMIAWYAGALVAGFGLSLVSQRWRWQRRWIEQRRIMTLRYQRGEITRAERSRLEYGDLTWRIALLAVACAAVAFIGLYVLVG